MNAGSDLFNWRFHISSNKKLKNVCTTRYQMWRAESGQKRPDGSQILGMGGFNVKKLGACYVAAHRSSRAFALHREAERSFLPAAVLEASRPADQLVNWCVLCFSPSSAIHLSVFRTLLKRCLKMLLTDSRGANYTQKRHRNNK